MSPIKILIPLLSATLLMAGSGKSIYNKECASCHGKKGEKHALGHSHSIHGMPANKVMSLTHDYASGKKKGMPVAKTIKKKFLNKYSQEDVKAVAEYVSKL